MAEIADSRMSRPVLELRDGPGVHPANVGRKLSCSYLSG